MLIGLSFISLGILAGTLLALTPAIHAADAPAPPTIAQITDLPLVHDITIGGTTISDWHGQGLVIHALGGQEPTLRPASEFDPVARLGWNEEGVLLQVEVTDTTPDEARDLNHLYQGDSVDLQLMSDNPADGMVQIVASPGRTADGSALRLQTFDYRDAKHRATAIRPRGAVHLTSHGYVLDLFLPWDSLNITPRDGLPIHLRFSVADLARRVMQKAIFFNGHTQAPWMDLPALRLAATAHTPAADLAIWGGYDEFKATYVNVTAEPQLAQQAVEVSAGGQVLSTGVLSIEGRRAVARLRFALPPIGQTWPQLAVRVGGKLRSELDLPDLQERRLQAFLSGGNQARPWGRTPAWLQPSCPNSIFTGATFPTFDYPDSAQINALVGAYSLSTAYFDASGRRASRPTTPGRYGAATQVIDAAGASFMLYTTLFYAGAEPSNPSSSQTADVAGNTATAVLLAARAIDPNADEFTAQKMDHDWWHRVRKTLNTETRYEYFVRLPSGYDARPDQRWPVIFYLHGSGGGNNPRDVRDNGPQIAAAQKPDFPFITVSLRSPGGWDPPAVEDVIDAVAATCRTDPQRYYLTGFSMGGIGAWAVALDDPERFAAIAPIGGRAGDPAQAARLKHVAVWVINGAADQTTTSADALRAVHALQAVGAAVKWTEIPGADHVPSHVIAYGWDDLYTWFLQHHR